MRRRAGALVPNEVAVIDVLVGAGRGGWLTINEIRAALASRQDSDGTRITNAATTYRITVRLFEMGAIERRWRIGQVERPCREFRIARHPATTT